MNTNPNVTDFWAKPIIAYRLLKHKLNTNNDYKIIPGLINLKTKYSFLILHQHPLVTI
jgi:hypothetical protein